MLTIDFLRTLFPLARYSKAFPKYQRDCKEWSASELQRLVLYPDKSCNTCLSKPVTLDQNDRSFRKTNNQHYDTFDWCFWVWILFYFDTMSIFPSPTNIFLIVKMFGTWPVLIWNRLSSVRKLTVWWLFPIVIKTIGCLHCGPEQGHNQNKCMSLSRDYFVTILVFRTVSVGKFVWNLDFVCHFEWIKSNCSSQYFFVYPICLK